MNGGPPGEPAPRETGDKAPAVGPGRPRARWAWTLVFAGLVPVGAVLIVAGGRADPVLRILGGAMLGGAVVIVLWLLAGGEDGDGDEVGG